MQRKGGPRHLRAERLEERQLLTTYTVINTNDSGAGSLRDAVAKANADARPDTIQFSAALSKQTIALTSDDLNPKTSNGGRSKFGRTGLIVTSPITIDGSAAADLTISGKNERRLFVVTDATGFGLKNASLALQNLTLADGLAKGGLVGGAGLGGAIFVDRNQSLNLTNCTFDTNGAVGGDGGRGPGGGGGMSYDATDAGGGANGGYAYGGPGLHFGNGGFGSGGGLGPLGNRPYGTGGNGGAGGFGGAGGVGNVGLDWNPREFQALFGGKGGGGGDGGFGGGGGAGGGGGRGFDNQHDAFPAGTGGQPGKGGFGAASGTAGGDGTAERGNAQPGNAGATGGGAGMGGALFGFNATVTIDGCTFVKNTATGGAGKDGAGGGQGLGGAIFNLGGKVTITKSTFTENKAGTDGGAIYNSDKLNDGHGVDVAQGNLVVADSLFDSNAAKNAGGAIFNSGIARADDVDLGRNMARSGSAVTASKSSSTNISGRRGPRAEPVPLAGMHAAVAVASPLRGIVSDNEADYDGGAFLNYGAMSLSGLTVENNSARRHNGGGIANFGRLQVLDCTIDSNESGLDGGGIANAAGARLTINRTTLQDNDAGQHGAAIFDRGLEQITNCDLRDNVAGDAGADFYELGGIGETFVNTFTSNGNEVAYAPQTIVGSAAGAAPTVGIRDNESDGLSLTFEAYAHSFTGGVRVAQGYMADNSGIPTPVIVTVPASGALPVVRIFDAFEGGLIREFRALALGGGKGASLAVDDVTGDGLDDVVLGSSGGVPSRVAVYDGADGKLLRSFAPFAARFPGGIHVAAGDTTGDGTAEIVVGSGSGATHPGLALFNALGKQLTAWPLPAALYGGGVNVAVVDRNADGYGDVVVAQASGDSQILVFDGRGGRNALATFNAYPAAFAGGVNITADDVDGDGIIDLVVCPANGNAQQVRAFNARTFKVLESFAAGNAFKKGAYVG